MTLTPGAGLIKLTDSAPLEDALILISTTLGILPDLTSLTKKNNEKAHDYMTLFYGVHVCTHQIYYTPPPFSFLFFSRIAEFSVRFYGPFSMMNVYPPFSLLSGGRLTWRPDILLARATPMPAYYVLDSRIASVQLWS